MKIAVIGAETLLGRELNEVLGARGTGIEIIPYAANAEGSFTEEEGEAVYVQPLEAKAIHDYAALLVAGTRDGALKTYGLAKEASGHPVVVDCTGELENEPEARIAAPLGGSVETSASWLQVIAHPAANALALVLMRLARYRPIRQAIAHIFEPASELGKRGISELQQQTTSLLSFKKLDKAVFDSQLSFNLLSAYGEEAARKLVSVEQRIERDLATIIGNTKSGAKTPMPSLRLLQAPVFHGYSISMWVEFESGVEAQALGEALASAQIEVRGKADEPPDPVGAAGQSGLVAGDIRVDRNNARAAWFWIVGDNLRLMADAAAELLRGLKGENG
ncbi:MAG TPA: Asd/ArgC dimerization domain-containing protein [Bryobacteraceae bacterium]|nr:Asd/ArgC dimerization domain-containing protein [Bryobacteraceae bacterium]HXE63007.1 Asd/ArgC dimerization domain-containing protein [Bryobacteraceae bacterium]